MSRTSFLLLASLAIPLLAGCVVARNPSYPAEWAAPDTQRIGNCPAIAGLYTGTGSMALDSGVECSTPRTAKTGEWQCSVDLAANLGLPDSGSAPVELRQSNGTTLEIIVGPGKQATTAILQEGKDFSCDADSLYFSGTENAFGSKMLSAAGLLVLTGGVTNHTRAFARSRDGELVMTVRGRMLFFYLGFPIAMSGTSHVRWVPVARAGEAQ